MYGNWKRRVAIPRSPSPCAFDAMLGWFMPTPAPCANTYSAFVSSGRSNSPETSPPTAGIATRVSIDLVSVPPRGEFARSFDVGREIDLAPLLAVDVECPHVAALRDVVDDPQVPDGRPLGRAHRLLDRLTELLGAARAECQQS